MYRYLFGPVPSRRLGISLGVDLVPSKVCSFDCIYCEVGKTTTKTLIRKEYVPIRDVIGELSDYLGNKPRLDYITFSGAGEPTLNSGIGQIIEFLRKNYGDYKLALLTNSSLLSDPEVRKDILILDVILPSLDAVSEQVYNRINRPVAGLTAASLIKGLIDLRRDYKGQIWLEIFIIPGLNDHDSELRLLAETVAKIRPDKVQLNSLDRPGTESWINHVPEPRLKEISEYFREFNVEYAGMKKSRSRIDSFNEDISDKILQLIKRRPCTDDDLAQVLNIHPNELNKYLSQLLKDDIITSEVKPRGTFFKIK